MVHCWTSQFNGINREMSDYLLGYEPQVRLFFLFLILAIMAAWEVAAPRRRQEIPRLLRWSNNLGVVVIDTLLVRLTFPILAEAWRCWRRNGAGGC